MSRGLLPRALGALARSLPLRTPAALALLATPALADGGEAIGVAMPLWSLIPFAGILLSIAILPLVAGHWWEHNKNRAIVSGLFAVPVVAFLLLSYGSAGGAKLVHSLEEYVSFICLLGALFVITGGIYIRGSLSGTPLLNTAILGIGALVASFIGTTGASVLLIRPLLRANAPRVKKVHIVVFFIFIVSNCGGLLTPLGDPPLFLGFLKGVPFGWTFNLWKEWLLVNGALLLIFNFWDQQVFAKEELERPGSQLEQVQQHEPLKIEGGLNFLFLLGVVLIIVGKGHFKWGFGPQEGLMALMGGLAYMTTNKANREANKFSWAPIVEVAVLFVGIFVCMIPALEILNAWGSGARPEVLGLSFGMQQPWQYFWSTGALSSFLDNAPTYLTFAATAAGKEGLSGDQLGLLLDKGAAAQALLMAISCGAVFMGANTYIGNGPNFMVKAIAEENGVKMPGFFGYMAYSLGILIPLFVVVTLVFFR